MRVLSVQSSVAYGHVGNSAAVFPLMRLGHEVVPVLTVHLSNHTGYRTWRGPLLAPADVADVLTGVAERGVLGTCDAVLSGYLGQPDIARVVADAVDAVRSANPDAVYCCDPVMGNTACGVFVHEDIPGLMRSLLLPLATIVTPNMFELQTLTGTTTRTLDDVLSAVETTRRHGPSAVLVTSVQTTETPPGTLQMLAVGPDGGWLATMPKLDIAVSGAGDVTSALFLAHWSQSGLASALRSTAASMHGILTATAAGGHHELRLVQAQEELVAPTASVVLQQIG